jgi:hypothetical protein
MILLRILPQRLPRGQHIRPKAQRQQLPHCPHNKLALLVKHEYRTLELQKLAQKLSAHSTRGAKVPDIGGHAHGFEGTQLMPCHDGSAHGDALGARADGVGGVFDVGAGYDV